MGVVFAGEKADKLQAHHIIYCTVLFIILPVTRSPLLCSPPLLSLPISFSQVPLINWPDLELSPYPFDLVINEFSFLLCGHMILCL